ncbi:T9SS type A sorting domain-containing protein [Chitinophaga agrisoli]|nr:T9SS type A sorting domain-containing protein [Chitinophaga agrisoli]
MKTWLLGLLLIVPIAGKAAIGISIGSPVGSAARNDDHLDIVVGVSSTYELDTIWAAVEDRSTPLVYDQDRRAYLGALSLTGLPQGVQHLVVFAKDVFGNSQTATKDFIFDSYPVLAVVSPVDYTSYQHKLHIKANVSDVGSAHCKGKIESSQGSFKLEFVNSIDTLVDVIPNINATKFDIVFSAIDSSNQETTMRVPVYRDNSSFLSPCLTSIGQIMDFKDHRVLMMVIDRNNFKHYNIVNTLDSSIEAVDLGPMQDSASDMRGTLCQGGAAFIIKYKTALGATGPGSRYHAYLWRNGALLNISEPLGTTSRFDVKSAGNYLMWPNDRSNIAITDLTTLHTIFIGPNLSTNGGYLSPEGDVAYSVSSSVNASNLFKYSISAQTTTQITNDNDYFNGSAIVEGNNIIYSKVQYGGKNDSVHLRVGTVDYNLGHPDFTTTRSYALNDGYALFNKGSQVWLWSPDKTVKQLSFFSTVSSVDLLGADGKAMFMHYASGRYYTDSSTSFTRVSGIQGETYYVNDGFYLALGGTLYKYNIPSGSLMPHIISIAPDTAIAGATVSIKGKNFIDVSAVSLGGVPADSFSVVGYSVIMATVGAGASGSVIVAAAGGADTLAGFTYLYSLPENNFKLSNTSASCVGAANGSILITSVQNSNYTATVTGNGVDTAYHFTTSIRIKDLAAGTYKVCLTVAGQPTYEQCFTSVIGQPKDLSVYMAVNERARELTLSMSGADLYNVTLNDATITTSNSQLTLALNSGVNEIMVTTDKACQGTVSKRVTLDAGNMVYPNPFHNTIRLNLGADNIKKGIITIYDLEGKLVYSREFANQSGLISLNVSTLHTASYILKLTADNEVSVFKIMKL